jgi:hypothetical protein
VRARGSGEVAGPDLLHDGLALLGDAARDRVLVLVTDGQVDNEDRILERVSAGLSGVRGRVSPAETALVEELDRRMITRIHAVDPD